MIAVRFTSRGKWTQYNRPQRSELTRHTRTHPINQFRNISLLLQLLLLINSVLVNCSLLTSQTKISNHFPWNSPTCSIDIWLIGVTQQLYAPDRKKKFFLKTVFNRITVVRIIKYCHGKV